MLRLRIISRFARQRPLASLSRCQYSTSSGDDLVNDTRWLHDFRGRIGKCFHHQLQPEQIAQLGRLANEVAQDWRGLLVGVHGFLTSRQRAGLLRQAVVWGEQDAMGHVNNVVYNRWAESGRMKWVNNFARTLDRAHAIQWRELATSRGMGMILRNIKTNFKFPMRYPDRVSVFHKLSTPVRGEDDAFVLDVAIVSEKHVRVSAKCVEDIVLYDYRTARKAKLAQLPFVLRAFEDTRQAQQEEAQNRLAQRRRLTEALQRIEAEMRT